MAAAFRVIIRRRNGKTEKRQFATLGEAVDDLETELRSVSSVIARAPRVERALGREYEPAEQVAVRGELRGPGRLRAGVGEDPLRVLRRDETRDHFHADRGSRGSARGTC